MTYLPAQPAAELATTEQLQATESRLSTRLDHLEGRIDRLDDRLSRLQTTLIGGFAAMVAAVLATGVLG